MSLNSYRASAWIDAVGPTPRRPAATAGPLILLVKDQEDALFEMKRVLGLSGYRVIETDNGQDAARRARCARPDLVLVDLGVPLLYELVAARQIMKQAFLGAVPFVVVARDDELDPYATSEICVRRNEYVTRLSDGERLKRLLGYLLPVGPQAAVV